MAYGTLALILAVLFAVASGYMVIASGLQKLRNGDLEASFTVARRRLGALRPTSSDLSEVGSGKPVSGFSETGTVSVLDFFLASSVGVKVDETVMRAALRFTSKEVCLYTGGLSLLVACVVGLLSQSIIGGVSAGAIFVFMVWQAIVKKAQKRTVALRNQLPDMYDSISSGLNSGLSLLGALLYTAEKSSDPLKSYLDELQDETSAGISLGESLRNLRNRLPIRELDSLLLALELQHKTGGNLIMLLQRASALQRENLALARELEVKTSQAKFSAKMVGILPLALLGVLSIFSKEYIGTFFKTPLGVVVFLGALCMEVAGYVLVKKLAGVDVL